MAKKKITNRRSGKKPATKNTGGTFRRKLFQVDIFTKILAIIIILIGLGILMFDGKNKNGELQQYQAIQIFSKIDDLGHEGIIDLWKRRTLYGSGHEEFDKIDKQYHSAETIKEKLEIADKMDSLFKAMDEYIHKVGAITTAEDIARDKRYHETDMLFEPLKEMME